jgi:hypothetical protein
MKYKCIRKCHWQGKKWNVGAVVDLDIEPPHHFQAVADKTPATTVLSQPQEDPLKLKVKKEIVTLSELSDSSHQIFGGFAHTLSSEKPLKSIRELKNKK